jgi:hypothetical protein
MCNHAEGVVHPLLSPLFNSPLKACDLYCNLIPPLHWIIPPRVIRERERVMERGGNLVGSWKVVVYLFIFNME